MCQPFVNPILAKLNHYRLVLDTAGQSDHCCVLTATLVEPRVSAPASLNLTNIRLAAGSKGTVPAPPTNMPKVGVALALMVVVTLLAGGAKHAPVVGLVAQIEMLTGSTAPPVSAVAVMLALTPKFAVATANAPVPVVPGMLRIPSLLSVAANTNMSGTGLLEAEKRSVLIPKSLLTGGVLVPEKVNSTSVGLTGADGVRVITKL